MVTVKSAFGSTIQRAHRVAWMLTFGPIPDRLAVLHRCDTPTCCNPAHLFLGTQTDNLRDMLTKDRNHKGFRVEPPIGALNVNAKFTEDTIREIRRRHAAGESMNRLGRVFGVWRTTIGEIVHRRTWAHIV